MRLVIAEKASFGRLIAEALGADGRNDGYREGSGWVVTWCQGHLVDLALPDAYEQWAGPWDLDKLPMIPDTWLWAPSADEGASRQLAIVERLLGRPDIESVVNACDADREGEGIFRRVYAHAGCELPVERLWSTAMTPEAIERDISRMRPGSDYDGLADAAEGRAKADWLVGLNATRAYTKLYGSKVNQGRVMTAVLAMIVERTLGNASFEPEPFWTVAADLGGWSVASNRFDGEQAAREVLAKAESSGMATLTLVERKDVKARAPELYDLTSLQRDASTRCGLAADATLDALEQLYLAGLATYPRADSRYITSEDAGIASALLPVVSDRRICGSAAPAFDMARADVGRIVNDAKVQGHGAIIPTTRLTADAFSGLSGAQRQVMLLICCRLLASVMDPGTRSRVKVACDIAGTEYTASGSTVKDASWIAVDEACKVEVGFRPDPDDAQASQPIPDGIEAGGVIGIAGVELKEGKTAPPKLYTESDLLSAMENAGRSLDDAELKAAMMDDASHSAGLGTPATRAEIIRKILVLGLAERRGRTFRATEKGIAVIDVTSPSLKSVELTASWELELSRIERGEAELAPFLERIAGYTAQVVSEAAGSFDPSKSAALGGRKPVASCPLCGSSVIKCKAGRGCVYVCESNRSEKVDGEYRRVAGCGFKMFGTVAGKALSDAQATRIIQGKTVKVSGLKSKSGSTFEAGLRLAAGNDGRIEFTFDGKRGKAPSRAGFR